MSRRDRSRAREDVPIHPIVLPPADIAARLPVVEEAKEEAIPAPAPPVRPAIIMPGGGVHPAQVLGEDADAKEEEPPPGADDNDNNADAGDLHDQLEEDLEAAVEENAAEEAEMVDLFYRQAAYVPRPHDRQLRADRLHPGGYGEIAHVHLLQTDNNVQPMMGAVHMIKPAANYSDKHIMFDVDGDINEGQKAMVERSRKGKPFQQGGRSTIMDRSAHIVYRKRQGVFEITVRRGVIDAELQQMLSKLSMHRMHMGGSHVVIIKGGRRYKLGLLTDLDLRHLLDLASECVSSYGVCGIEIVESSAGSGPLYKGEMHKARFKSKSRRGKGAAHRRRRVF